MSAQARASFSQRSELRQRLSLGDKEDRAGEKRGTEPFVVENSNPI